VLIVNMLQILIHTQSLDLFISQHVVDQTREDYLGGISEKTDRPAVHPVHTLWYVGEEMKRSLSISS